MKYTRKWIALLLAALLLFSSLPFSGMSVFAAASDAKVTALKTQIDRFVSNMDDDNVYTNMKAAYDAYIPAMKLYDSAVYGENNANVTDAKLESATAALKSAVDNMSVWSASTADQKVTMPNDSSPVTSNDAYGGILYASVSTISTASNKKVNLTHGADSVRFSIAMPSVVVLLYNGDAASLKVPVMYGYHNMTGIGTNKKKIYTCYPTDGAKDYSVGSWSDSITLPSSNPSFSMGNSKWNGRNEKKLNSKDQKNENNGNGLYSWSNPYGGSYHFGADPANIWTENWDSGDQDANNGYLWWTYANYLKFTGSGTYTNGLLTKKIGWFSVMGYKKSESYNACITNNSTFYVIDYYSATQAIQNKKSLLKFNGKRYLNNELATLLTNFDKCTTAVTNTGYTESEAALKATAIAKTLNDGAKGLNAISSVSETYSNYEALRKAMDTAAAGEKKGVRGEYADNNATSGWTTSTFSAFKSAFEACRPLFNMTTESGYNDYNATGNSSADNTKTALVNAYNALDKRADFSTVEGDVAADSKYVTVNSNATQYTYDSFKAFAQARAAVKAYADWTSAVKLDTGRAAKQSELDSADASLATAYAALESNKVEEQSYYDTFNAIKEKVESVLNSNGKYTTESVAAMRQALETETEKVMHTVTAEEAELLGVPAGTVMYNTVKDSNRADGISAELLTAFSDNCDTQNAYVKYTVEFKVVKDGSTVKSESSDAVFGSTQTFTLGEYYDEDAIVVWETETYENGEKQSSNKTYGDESVSKIINSDVKVTATVTSRKSGDQYLYKIYNGNGKLVGAEYHATGDVTEFEDAKALVAIPFYTFKEWYTTVDEASKTVMVIADYEQLETVALTAYNGSLTNMEDGSSIAGGATVLYDISVKVDYSGANTFYAWAVKIGSQYTIVSYEDSYVFYSHTNLNFVPVIIKNEKYYYETENGEVAVTAETVASTPENRFGTTEGEYLGWKLKNKAPFIAVVGTKPVSETKQRAFVMVTKGCVTPYTRLGIKFSKDGTDPADAASRAISSVLETGQFSVTLNTNDVSKAMFRATVNYDYSYTHNGATANFDVMDTSALQPQEA